MKLLFATGTILFVLMSMPLGSQASQAVRCQNKLYPLDLAMTIDAAPFGELLNDRDLDISPLLQTLLWGAITAKAVPTLKSPYLTFLSDEKNETDFSRPFVWQANDLPFPSTEVKLTDLPSLASICRDPGATSIAVYDVLRTTKRGRLTVLEYDRKLMNEISNSPLSISFLYMSVFLEPYAKDAESRAMMNSLLHARRTISRDTAELDALANQYLKLPASSGVCARSSLMVEELQRQLALPCEEISETDLTKVHSLSLRGNGQETLPFEASDLMGLKSLTELEITNTAYLIDWFTASSLQDLGELKKLKLSQNDFNETPKIFMEGPFKLTSLDLSSNLIFELKENAFRQVFVDQATDSETITLDLSHNGATRTPRRNAYVHKGSFNSCQAVTHLSLKDMNILAIDSEVFEPLVNLRELDLSNNSLRRIRSSFHSSSLANLRILDLSGNWFTAMTSDDLSDLTSLEELRIGHTGLEEFPSFLLNRPGLKRLVFCGADFTEEDYAKIGEQAKLTNPDLDLQFCE